MKKYKAVIMDFDLTIADTADVIEECLYLYALRFGYDLDRKIIRAGIGMTAENIYRSAGICDDKQLKIMHESYDDFATDIMIDKTKFFPGVVESIAELYNRGVLFAVLSLKVSSHIREPLKRHGLDTYIHSVIGLGDIEHGKPHPEGIYVLADRLGVSAPLNNAKSPCSPKREQGQKIQFLRYHPGCREFPTALPGANTPAAR